MDYVYVLTNEWAPAITKIGATTDINERFNGLHNVLPGKSILRWQYAVADAFVIENLVRNALAPFKIDSSKDWFQCPADVAINQFKIFIDAKNTNDLLQKLALPTNEKIDAIEKLGAYCASIRKKQGATQKELADTANVGVRFISEFERGKITCEIGKVHHVLRTLGVDLVAIKRP